MEPGEILEAVQPLSPPDLNSADSHLSGALGFLASWLEA